MHRDSWRRDYHWRVVLIGFDFSGLLPFGVAHPPCRNRRPHPTFFLAPLPMFWSCRCQGFESEDFENQQEITTHSLFSLLLGFVSIRPTQSPWGTFGLPRPARARAEGGGRGRRAERREEEGDGSWHGRAAGSSEWRGRRRGFLMRSCMCSICSERRQIDRSRRSRSATRRRGDRECACRAF